MADKAQTGWVLMLGWHRGAQTKTARLNRSGSGSP